MAKNYFGVVLTTKEHDKYRLVVYRYKDPGILNTCPNIAAVSRLASGTSLAE